MMVREFAEANDVTCFSCVVEAMLDLEPKFPESGFQGTEAVNIHTQLPEELEEEFQVLLEAYARKCHRGGRSSS